MDSDMIVIVYRWIQFISIAGWWYTYPSEKKNMSSSIGMMTFPILYMENKNVVLLGLHGIMIYYDNIPGDL